jgi:hypothetical protein
MSTGVKVGEFGVLGAARPALASQRADMKSHSLLRL